MCRVIGRGQSESAVCSGGEAALGQIIMLHAAVIAGWTTKYKPQTGSMNANQSHQSTQRPPPRPNESFASDK